MKWRETAGNGDLANRVYLRPLKNKVVAVIVSLRIH